MSAQSTIVNPALRWQAWSVLWIWVAGGLLHFVFAWSGYTRSIAWLAPVNESTWEHCKMAFWPGVAFALIEWGAINRRVNNFPGAKSIGLMVMPPMIALLYYGYTGVTGEHYLAADILTFVLAVVIGEWIALRIMTAFPPSPWIDRWGTATVLLTAAAFVLFSYHPPAQFLFEDPRTGGYGILKNGEAP